MGSIAAGDVKALSGIKGIGTRTAQRIVLDLKGKLVMPEGTPVPAPTNAEADGSIGVAEAALRQLGFTPQQIAAAVAALPRDRDLTEEEAVNLAVRSINVGR
jgi:Holliday junction DNA helicase RuvA